ncbi:MAG: hypothetical protein PHN75_06085 [Syntrophales bacterium]|nr:hypothetical protein [Syntrophales bacterium]
MKKPRSFFTGSIFLMIAVALILSVASDGRAQSVRAYVSSQDGTTVYVFDLAKNSLLKTIDIFTPTPLGAALPPNINDVITVGGKIFMTVPGPEVAATGINALKVIDPRTDAVVSTLKMDLTPSGLLEYEGKIYVVNRYGNTIQVIDPDTLQIVRTIPFSKPKQVPLNNPVAMEIARGKIYLPYPGGLSRPGLVQVLDLKSGKTLKTIDFTLLSSYGPLAIKRIDENKIYLGCGQSVAVLDTGSDEIIKTIKLADKDVYVQSFVIGGKEVYAANGVSTVSVIDPVNDSFIKEIDIGYHSYACHLKAGIAAAPGKIIVADAGRGLKIIDTGRDRLDVTIAAQEPLGPIAIIVEK